MSLETDDLDAAFGADAPTKAEASGDDADLAFAEENPARGGSHLPSVPAVIGGIVATPFELAARAGSQMAALPVQAGASLYQLATAPPGTKVERANEAVRKVGEAMTYQPRTEVAKAMSGTLDTLQGGVQSAGQAAGRKVKEWTGSTAAGAVADLAIEAAPALLGKKAGDVVGENVIRPAADRIATQAEARAAALAADHAPVSTAIENARSSGFRLPPSQAGGPLGKLLEGVGGKTQTEIDLSRSNARNTNSIAAREIGLEGQELSENTIERAKQKQFDVYDRVRNAGRIDMDDTYRADLERVRERTGQEAKDFPEDFSESIDKEIEKFNKPNADAGSMLEKIKKLRDRAGRNMKALDADTFELGIAQKKIANAMENQIDRSVQTTNPDLISDFRKSRVQLAKIYNVEEALGPSGNVTAAVLARQLKRGVPLTGGLKSIAETYQNFPKVMRSVEGLGGHAPFSALDYLVGGVEALANPGSATRIVGALAARPVARGIIGSEAYQAAAIKPRPPELSAAAKALRKIAGPKELPDLERGP